VRTSILRIKIVHTVIFFVLSACVLYSLYSGIFDRITTLTWVAVAAGLVEGVVLMACGWKCPLAKMAENLGAASGSVTDIFLPHWFAKRIFSVCGTLFTISCIILVVRVLQR
jgi:hypothetical protein